MEELDCKKFACNVKKYREKLGYSKGFFSSLVGCDISYIGKIERCEKYPNLKMIFKIANALQLPASTLFTFE